MTLRLSTVTSWVTRKASRVRSPSKTTLTLMMMITLSSSSACYQCPSSFLKTSRSSPRNSTIMLKRLSSMSSVCFSTRRRRRVTTKLQRTRSTSSWLSIPRKCAKGTKDLTRFCRSSLKKSLTAFGKSIRKLKISPRMNSNSGLTRFTKKLATAK